MKCNCDDAIGQACPECHPLGDGLGGYFPEGHVWQDDCACISCLRRKEIQSSCAANPWRYDVENAPKDGSEVLLAWKNYVGTMKAETFHWDELAETWMNDDGGFIERFIAFATINAPEADA